MKKMTNTILLISLLAITTVTKAQFFDVLRTSPWVVGAGWNIVDDNGQKTKNIFDFKNSFNIPAYPSSIRVEKIYKDGISFVFNGSYNRYQSKKVINGDLNQTTTFLAFDLGAKYNFSALYNINQEWFNFDTDVFDYYATMGFGATFRNTDQVGNSGTVNIGFGLNSFVYNNWGINLEAVGKFGLSGKFIQTAANYTQYSFGIIYKIESNKRLSGGGSFNSRKPRSKLNIE